jgi:hypothetical protein
MALEIINIHPKEKQAKYHLIFVELYINIATFV